MCNRVGFLLDVLLVQGARMEERLDDAINVLRNHAEPHGLHLGPVGPHGSFLTHTSPSQLDHLVNWKIFTLLFEKNLERKQKNSKNSLLSLSVYRRVHILRLDNHKTPIQDWRPLLTQTVPLKLRGYQFQMPVSWFSWKKTEIHCSKWL